MEEKREEIEETTSESTYVPRPKWQLICAWIGITIVGIGFLLYVYQIANGGL